MGRNWPFFFSLTFGSLRIFLNDLSSSEGPARASIIMKHNPTHIGQVESVSGNSVTIKMASNYPSNMPIVDGTVYRIGQIGSFLKIPLGYRTCMGDHTGAGVLAMPDSLLMAYKENPSVADGHRWLRMILVGEQVGSSFERGVLQSPTAGDQVHLVTNEDLRIVYGGATTHNRRL